MKNKKVLVTGSSGFLGSHVADVLEEQGYKVIIAAAGMSAALPGVVASQTKLPVIGVPMKSDLMGIDSLLSIVQMPKGVPVACMSVGKHGAINAALYAKRILDLMDFDPPYGS